MIWYGSKGRLRATIFKSAEAAHLIASPKQHNNKRFTVSAYLKIFTHNRPLEVSFTPTDMNFQTILIPKDICQNLSQKSWSVAIILILKALFNFPALLSELWLTLYILGERWSKVKTNWSRSFPTDVYWKDVIAWLKLETFI